mmetsp:Transcript_43113/g.131328  ORF Transcript_43113/g.131328 Transcript_43113/m.131328 type:complete len:171 (-) Transcript_43113:574-1086(-)
MVITARPPTPACPTRIDTSLYVPSSSGTKLSLRADLPEERDLHSFGERGIRRDSSLLRTREDCALEDPIEIRSGRSRFAPTVRARRALFLGAKGGTLDPYGDRRRRRGGTWERVGGGKGYQVDRVLRLDVREEDVLLGRSLLSHSHTTTEMREVPYHKGGRNGDGNIGSV